MLRRPSQSGMVSIVVTLVLMLVISLIVIGFAQASRIERSSVLSRQLSSQAFFAAESGINDAQAIINKAIVAGDPIPEKTSCGPNAAYATNPEINSELGVSYSCLLVNTRLKSLVVNPLVAGADSVNVPIDPVGVASSLTINWASTVPPASQGDISSRCSKPASEYFPSATSGNWKCPYGLLRVDLVPTDSWSRSSLTNGQKTFFIYPTGSAVAASVDYSAINGAVVPARCALAVNCEVTVTNLSASQYAVRLSSRYASGAVALSVKDAGGATLELQNAQAQVDATGRAGEVLRRLQVRLSLTGSKKTADYAIESASSICKRFEIYTDMFKNRSDIQGQDQNNPMCRPLVVAPPSPAPASCATSKDILMTLDYSVSMLGSFGGQTRLQSLKAAARNFIDTSGVSTVANHEGLITFSGPATLRVPFSDDTSILKNAVTNTPTSSGTDFTAALTLSENVLLNHASSRSAAHKTLIFFTDGNKGASEAQSDIVAISDRMAAQNVDIYVISIAGAGIDEDLLRSLTANNGVYASASNPVQLQAIFESIAAGAVCP